MRRIIATLTALAILGIVLSSFSPLVYSSIYTRTMDTVAGHSILKIVRATEKPTLNYPNVIFQDKNGIFYFGNMGIDIFDEQQNQIHSYSKDKLKLGPWGTVRHISQSSDNKIWVASMAVGDNLGYFDGDTWINFGQLFEFPIRTIFPSNQDGLWFAAGAHLVHYDGKEWSHHIDAYKEVKKTNSLAILQGLQDSEGFIWVGIEQGILRYDEKKKAWQEYLYPKMVKSPQHMYEDSKNNLWFANPWEGDVSYYQRKVGSWLTFNLLDKTLGSGNVPFKITGLTEDNNEVMLFTTTRGLVTFDPSKNEWQLFTPENSGLPDANVTCIYKDQSGRLWLGTGRGIIVLAP